MSFYRFKACRRCRGDLICENLEEEEWTCLRCGELYFPVPYNIEIVCNCGFVAKDPQEFSQHTQKKSSDADKHHQLARSGVRYGRRVDSNP